MNTTLKNLLNHVWYVQEVIILDYTNRILQDTTDIDKIKASALYAGTNHNLKDDNELMNRYVYNLGAIDGYLVIELR